MIPWIIKFLSKKGQLYLVTIKENNNSELQEIFRTHGFKSKIIKSRKAGIEGLAVTCFSRI